MVHFGVTQKGMHGGACAKACMGVHMQRYMWACTCKDMFGGPHTRHAWGVSLQLNSLCGGVSLQLIRLHGGVSLQLIRLKGGVLLQLIR